MVSLLLRICLKEDDERSFGGRTSPGSRYHMPLLLIVTALMYEFAATQIMGVLSDLYKAVSSRDMNLFRVTLIFALIVVTIIAVLKSVNSFARDFCAVQWRSAIVVYIHSGYLSSSLISPIASEFLSISEQVQQQQFEDRNGEPLLPKPDSRRCGKHCLPSGVDQRATQDVDRLTNHAAHFVSDVVILPAVILFYTIYLTRVFGWVVPALCYTYFAIGATATYFFAQPLVPLVYTQEHWEGEFRREHVQLCLHIDQLWMLRGIYVQIAKMNNIFVKLVCTIRRYIYASLWLNICTNWIAYAGSIVNYVVVGAAIFHMYQEAKMDASNSTAAATGSSSSSGSSAQEEDVRDDSGGNDTSAALIAAQLAEGSYACLYLVNSLSKIIQSAELMSEIAGLVQRVTELLEAISMTKNSSHGRLGPATTSNSGHTTTAAKGTTNTLRSVPQHRRQRSVDNGMNARITPAMAEAVNEGILLTATPGFTNSSVPQASTTRSSAKECSLPLLAISHLDVYAPVPIPAPLQSNHSLGSRFNVGAGTGSSSSGSSSRLLLADLNVTVYPGMRLLVTGPSGCGKSTLLKLLAAVATGEERSPDKRGGDEEAPVVSVLAPAPAVGGDCCEEARADGVRSQQGIPPYHTSNNGKIVFSPTLISADGKAPNDLISLGNSTNRAHEGLQPIFCPQSPYCFHGTLRENLWFPSRPPPLTPTTRTRISSQRQQDNIAIDGVGDLHEREVSVLRQVGLDYFVSFLNDDDDDDDHYKYVLSAPPISAYWTTSTASTTSSVNPNMKPTSTADHGCCEKHASADSGAGRCRKFCLWRNKQCDADDSDDIEERRSSCNPYVRDWSSVISQGEKQRIAVARVLLRQPSLAFFDEVSSSLDESTERLLYEAICSTCSTFISIGHRSSLRQYHTHELQLTGPLRQVVSSRGNSTHSVDCNPSSTTRSSTLITLNRPIVP